MQNKDFYSTYLGVVEWAQERDIFLHGKPFGQLKLLASEVIELQDAINSGVQEDVVSELGDCLVVLTIIAEMMELTPMQCYAAAYEKIRYRRGKLDKDGVFRKES